jgi:hypothetical protein
LNLEKLAINEIIELTQVFIRLVKCLLANAGTSTTSQTMFLNKIINLVGEHENQVSHLHHQYNEMKVVEFKEKRGVNFDDIGSTYETIFKKLFDMIKSSTLSSHVFHALIE